MTTAPQSEGNAQISEIADLNPRTELAKKDVSCPFLEMKNLPVSDVTIRTWGERVPKGGSRFVNGDTLLARITPCLENGKTGLVDFLEDGEVGTGSTEYVVMRPRSGVPKALVYCLAVNDEFRAFAMRHMVGTSGRQRVAAADLMNFAITIPGVAELKRFEHETDMLLARVKTTVEESRALRRTRDELLPLLMSGKLTVKDADDRASDVL